MRAILSCFALFSAIAFADDHWPQYRGPDGNGHSTAKDVPTEFAEGKNIRWKAPIHDKGWSSPVVWGKRVWVTTGKEDGTELFAIGLDVKSGEVAHDLKLFAPKKPVDIRKYNTYASPTPCLDDGRGYFHFGTYGTACVDLDSGKAIWKRDDIECDHWRGPASSPIIHGKHLFLTFDGHDKQFVIALDKATGKTVWEKKRSVKYKTDDGDYKKAFSTPHVIDVDGQSQLVSSAAEGTIAYDPESGKELWTIYHGGMNEAGRPVFAHGLLYLTAGHTRTLLAAKPGAGDLTESDFAWTLKKDGPTRPSPIVVGNHLYVSSDEGNAFCLDAKTGKQIWKERLGGPTSASPIFVDGVLWFACENGKVDLVAAKPDFQRVATNALKDGCKASPAAVGDAVYLRTFTHLYCVGK